LRRVVWQTFTDVSGVLASSIIRAIIEAESIVLMMEAASTCETSLNVFQTTRRYNPEDSHLQRIQIFTFRISLSSVEQLKS
jgi:hypothetical protein